MLTQITLAEALINLRRDFEIAQLEGKEKDIKFKIEDVEVEFQISAASEVSGTGSGGLNAGFWKLNLQGGGKESDQISHKIKLKIKPHITGVGDLEVSGTIPSE